MKGPNSIMKNLITNAVVACCDLLDYCCIVIQSKRVEPVSLCDKIFMGMCADIGCAAESHYRVLGRWKTVSLQDLMKNKTVTNF